VEWSANECCEMCFEIISMYVCMCVCVQVSEWNRTERDLTIQQLQSEQEKLTQLVAVYDAKLKELQHLIASSSPSPASSASAASAASKESGVKKPGTGGSSRVAGAAASVSSARTAVGKKQEDKVCAPLPLPHVSCRRPDTIILFCDVCV
jgi:hypothetical protein